MPAYTFTLVAAMYCILTVEGMWHIISGGDVTTSS